MDRGTFIGLAFGAGVLLLAVALNDIWKLRMFLDAPSFLIVVGGSVASVMISYPLEDVLKMFRYVQITFFNQKIDPIDTIDTIVSLAEGARRDGLLSLENRMDEIKDPFLAGGLRMAMDGLSPEVVERTMHTEIEAVNARHLYYKSILENIGKYAPAFGMMGTVIGLVLMLADFDPSTVGLGMAVALITTLYGALLANLVVLPMADKLGFLNEFEMTNRELTMKGVLSIQASENPRVIKNNLLMYIPANRRPVESEGA